MELKNPNLAPPDNGAPGAPRGVFDFSKIRSDERKPTKGGGDVGWLTEEDIKETQPRDTIKSSLIQDT